MKKAVTVEFFFKFHFGFTLVQTIDLFYIWYAAYFFLQLKSLKNSHTENPQRLLSSSQEIFDAKVEESQRKEQE